MLRDITLGQYYRTESVIHALDPRVKIVGTFSFIISLFLVKNFIGYVIAGLFLVICIKLSNVPPKFIFRGMKAIFFLLMITMVFNLFLTPGEPLVSNNLTDGLEDLLKPLKKVRVPVHEISMMMSIALRFIPILMEETDKIMKAQMARGADFESGSIMNRAKSLVPLLVPLFISAFRRANDLAMAMEARCYRGGEGRTKMKPLVYKRMDVYGLAIIFGYVGCCLVFGRILFR